MADDTETLPLSFAMNWGWIKLPVAVMNDVGPAAQTFGAFIRKTNRETFMSVSQIALHACLPVATTRKHLLTLNERGWLENTGRQKTRTGIPRRTCTWKLTKQSHDMLKPYNALPWWAYRGGFPWATKSVLSVVMSRMLALESVAKNDCPHDDIEDAIEAIGGDERYEFSLNYLMKQTGLGRESVISGKRHLKTLGIVLWYSRNDRQEGHLLVPNPDCRIVRQRLGSDGEWSRYRISLALAR
ncbi:MAG: helix-turn-helix domain-containing protein [Planctomycetales bacterium]|nr:helix-turn-helix domain-containing protein [Planctomycetales bacterium]